MACLENNEVTLVVKELTIDRNSEKAHQIIGEWIDDLCTSSVVQLMVC